MYVKIVPHKTQISVESVDSADENIVTTKNTVTGDKFRNGGFVYDELDLLFVKHKTKGERSLNYHEFVSLLRFSYLLFE